MFARVRQNERAAVSRECECSMKMNRCLIVRHVFNIVLLLLLLRYYVHRSLPHSSRTVIHVLRRNTGTHTVTEEPAKTTSMFLTRASVTRQQTKGKKNARRTPNRTLPKTSIRRRRMEKKNPSHMVFNALAFGGVASQR